MLELGLLGVEVQKLEEILRTEEVARHALADARDRARIVIREAEAAAAKLVADEKTLTAQQVASVDAEARGEARSEADALATRAAAALESQRVAARSRVDDVARRIVDELAG
jgi:vacuolar-type H+-ATPase subunit H